MTLSLKSGFKTEMLLAWCVVVVMVEIMIMRHIGVGVMVISRFMLGRVAAVVAVCVFLVGRAMSVVFRLVQLFVVVASIARLSVLIVVVVRVFVLVIQVASLMLVRQYSEPDMMLISVGVSILMVLANASFAM